MNRYFSTTIVLNVKYLKMCFFEQGSGAFWVQ